jgi:hypothetical protein
MDGIINSIAAQVGLDSVELLALAAIIMVVSGFVGRIIPDDATGLLGLIRKLAKILGLYASNRITSQQTVNDVARRIIDK